MKNDAEIVVENLQNGRAHVRVGEGGIDLEVDQWGCSVKCFQFHVTVAAD